MSYPQPMANWDAMVRNACLLKSREARIAAVRAAYPVPDFLRRETRELIAGQRQGDFFDTDGR